MKRQTRAILPALAACLQIAAPAAAAAEIGDADRLLARAILEELVAIPTVKKQGKVPLLAEALAARFRAAGFAADDIVMLPVEIDGETTTGMLVRYRGASGASARKPIALLGHMDVVGAVGANWTSDPFTPVEKDGYLYGRGVVDNKAEVALLSATFIRLKRAGWVPDRDLVLALSGDEESGSRTTQKIAAHPWLLGAEFALNADAGTGEMERDGSNPVFFIEAAEKTSVSFHVETRNRGGHSSMPRPDNALYEMADAIKALQRLRFPVEFNDINRSMAADLAAHRPGELGAAFKTLLGDPGDAAARAVVEKYPEDAHVLWTTCVPTMVQGGNARNALPQNVSLTVHCRIMPGTSLADVEARLSGAIGNPAVKVAVDEARASSPVSPIRPDLVAALERAVQRNYPGASVRPEMSSGGGDGRYYRRAGVPTYGVGSLALVHPDDDRMHGIDERLRLDSFYKELDFWDLLLRDLAGGGGAVRR